MEALKEVVGSGQPGAVRDLADLEALYVPDASEGAVRAWLKDLEGSPAPEAQVLPLEEEGPLASPFGRTFNLEVTRGCGRGCRFCLIDHITRPRRDRSLRDALEKVEEGTRLTPARKVLLVGAGVSDHPDLKGICEQVVGEGLGLSVPSIRPDEVDEELVAILARGGQRRLTVAPDGPTPRMREIINKPMDDDVVLEACRAVLAGGMRAVKLYFIVGLPGETEEDVRAVVELVRQIADLGFGPGGVHISVNPLVPKPWTPFQWVGMADLAYVRSCLRAIRSGLAGDPRIVLSGLDPKVARLQAILSLGGRELGRAIELAAYHGGGLGAWRRAFREAGIEPSRYLRPKDPSEPLPWEVLRVGLNRSWLLREYEKALAGEPTPPCWVKCSSCGVCGHGGG
ncbi:hypothetical protein DRO32_00370 [Candidatus Bathyarchaeota archaeon]|nr:MAG: hypothetical protein DRO32_00370 [Candidatus Bathyarchaeota archaeon]